MTPQAPSPVASSTPTSSPPGVSVHVPGGATTREGRFVFGRFLQLILERLWVIVLLMVGFGIGGAVLSNRVPDTFESKSTILVEAGARQLVNFESRGADYSLNQTTLNTLVESIRNLAVLERVVRTNQLTTDLRFTGSTTPITPGAAAQRLQGMMSARIRTTTRLIDISVHGTNAEITAILARSLAQEFIADRDERATKSTRSGATALEAEAVTLAEKVKKGEKKSLKFREDNDIISLRSRSEVVGQTMNRLNQEVEKARNELEAAESDMKLFTLAGKDIDKLLLLKSIATDTTVVQMRQQVIAQELVVSGFTNRYKPAHPKRITAEKLLADQRATLLDLALQAGQNLEVRANTLRTQMKRDQDALETTEKEFKRITNLTGEYSALEREVESDTAMLSSILKRSKELDMTTRIESVPMSIAESPIGNGYRIGPQRTSTILKSIALGLALGIGFIYLLQRIDSSLRTVDEVEERLSLPVLGAVATHRRKGKLDAGSEKTANLVTLEDPTCVTAEGFRSLRTQVLQLGRGDDIKVQLFTSAIPGEGKSYCSANHAATLAKAGHRVVLIDLDLRRPTIGKLMAMGPDLPGVSSFLLGQKSFTEIQHATPVKGLTVIPAGPRIPNPAEQLTRPYLTDLLNLASSQFEYVVIDSAPVNAVSDTLSFLAQAQVVLLVVRAGSTAEPIVRRGLLELKRAGNPARGVVLNQLPHKSGRGNYYYYFSDDGYYSAEASNEPNARKRVTRTEIDTQSES